MEIKVSLIIIAYNIEKYIERCLLSVINQKFKMIEIIIVNDGSTDNTLLILEKYKQNDKRIKIINQSNKGSIEARKTGLKYASGEYLLFIDGDDWLELDCVEKLYNSVILKKADILIYNFFWSYDSYKKIIAKFNIKDEDIMDNPIKSLLCGNISPCIWNKFIKREYIEKNDIEFPNNISFAEDLATVASLLIHKPKIGILNESLYNYYQRENSITKEISSKVLDVNVAILFIKEQMLKSEIYYELENEFEMLVYYHLFVQRFLKMDKNIAFHKMVYKQYKKYKINKKNLYIKNFINAQPISLRIRMITYNKSYYLGIVYDFMRTLIK